MAVSPVAMRAALGSLVAASRVLPQLADEADRVDPVVAVGAALEVVAAAPAVLLAVALVAAEASQAADETVVVDEAAPEDVADAAPRMRRLSVIAPGVPPIKSEPSFSSPRKTPCSMRNPSP